MVCILHYADGDTSGGAELTVSLGKLGGHMGICIFDSMVSKIQFNIPSVN